MKRQKSKMLWKKYSNSQNNSKHLRSVHPFPDINPIYTSRTLLLFLINSITAFIQSSNIISILRHFYPITKGFTCYYSTIYFNTWSFLLSIVHSWTYASPFHTLSRCFPTLFYAIWVSLYYPLGRSFPPVRL